MNRLYFLITVLLVFVVMTQARAATSLYANGFETDTTGWFSTTRTVSGTNGIPAASGGYYGLTDSNNTFTQWGGYNFGTTGSSFQEYTTSIDIYLDVDGGWTNDTRLDFSSSINQPDGNFLRDFIFNMGFYNDATGPGANTNRFVISAGNNSQPGSAYAKDPGHNPNAISSTGWYTFEHHFYNNSGVLAVDMSIYDASDTLVQSWTLSNPGDTIASVGGNRYGWFDYNQFTTLAIDNASLTAVPEPASLGLLALGGLAMLRRRRA